MDDQIELAWAAGFFDGEGCVSLHRRNGVLWLQVKQVARPDGAPPDTLVRFHRAVGRGRIGGPYSDRPTRKGFSELRRPIYLWYALDHEADVVLERLWAQLGEAKRDDVVRVRGALRAA